MLKNKITEENTVIGYFREKYPLFTKGKFIRSESPDFMRKTGGNRTT